MKIELEITDEEIRQTMNSVVKAAVKFPLNHWSVADQVKKMVQVQWPLIIEDMIKDMIQEMVKDHEAMKAKIAEEIAKKLRAQVNAALKQVQAE